MAIGQKQRYYNKDMKWSPLCSNRPDPPSLIAFFRPFLAIFWQLPLYIWQNWGSDGHFTDKNILDESC